MPGVVCWLAARANALGVQSRGLQPQESLMAACTGASSLRPRCRHQPGRSSRHLASRRPSPLTVVSRCTVYLTSPSSAPGTRDGRLLPSQGVEPDLRQCGRVRRLGPGAAGLRRLLLSARVSHLYRPLLLSTQTRRRQAANEARVSPRLQVRLLNLNKTGHPFT